MATSIKAPKAKSTSGKSTKPPVRRPFERPQWEQDQPCIPKVGALFWLELNEAPFWENPRWGAQVLVKVCGIRDLVIDPLTAAEFAQFATQNVGRHLIECEWSNHYDDDDKDAGQCQFFWNDCRIDTFYDKSQSDPSTGRCDFQIDPDSPDQPYDKPALQIVYRSSDLGHVYAPTMEDRLKLIERLGQLRNEADGDPLEDFRVRPVVGFTSLPFIPQRKAR